MIESMGNYYKQNSNIKNAQETLPFFQHYINPNANLYLVLKHRISIETDTSELCFKLDRENFKDALPQAEAVEKYSLVWAMIIFIACILIIILGIVFIFVKDNEWKLQSGRFFIYFSIIVCLAIIVNCTIYWSWRHVYLEEINHNLDNYTENNCFMLSGINRALIIMTSNNH